MSADPAQTLDHAGTLGALLTAGRQEAEGYELLRTYLALARQMPGVEPSAWVIHALATAAQYLGKYDEADALFDEALTMTQAHHWRNLEHFVLHHWGRCLAEQRRLSEAQSRFERSLAIRQELGDPRQESSRRALAELASLQVSSGHS